MKNRAIFSILVLIALYSGFVHAQKRPAPRPRVLSAREIAAKVLPSVVLIITQDENGQPIAQGSGFVYKPGLVVSNLHVFERATNAIVKDVKTGEISKAIEVVGMNAKQDICIVRIDNTRFPSISIGDSWNVQTGDEIYVASNPKGLEGSFAKGIVSSVREKGRLLAPKGKEDEYTKIARDMWTLDDRTLFQIDAAISPGSSGGVLVNTKAEAIGIIKSSVVSGQNLNFASPIEQLIAVPLKFNNSIQLAGACAYTDRSKERLKGLVKKVIEKTRHERIVDGRLIDEGILVDSTQTFDPYGNEIESEVFDMIKGTLAWRFRFEYDENRLKISYVQEFLNGQPIKGAFRLEQGIYNKLYNRKFSGSLGAKDDQGGQQVFDSAGEMIEWYLGGKRIVYQYDGDGRAVESNQWGGNRLEIRTRFRYKEDKNGNWVERKEYMNFPNANVDATEWSESKVTYREISYYN